MMGVEEGEEAEAGREEGGEREGTLTAQHRHQALLRQE